MIQIDKYVDNKDNYMTWPSPPTDGLTATVNGVQYIYNGTNSVWDRVGSINNGTGVDSLTIGNLVVTQATHLGAAANVFISGGSVGKYLAGDGSGGLRWEPPTAASFVSNGTSNVNVSTGNISISVAGTVNSAVFTTTGVNIDGYTTVTGNITAGNVSASKLTSTVSTGTAPLTVTSTTRVANLNVDHANISDYSIVTRQTSGIYYPSLVSGNATSNYALSVNPNISFDNTNAVLNSKNITITNTANVDNLVATSNVTTSSLSVSTTANFIGTTTVLLGDVANVRLAGGSVGQYLQTDSTGNVSWATVSLPIINNGTSNVTIAPSGNIVVNSSGNSTLTITSTGANIAGYANVNGNITSSGNITTTSNVSASMLTSTIATGTAPLVVTSTTRVNNLNASRANISDYTSVTNTNSGCVYVAFANASSTGNYALQSNTAIYANLSTGNLHSGNFIGNLTGTVTGSATTAGTVTTAAQPNITSVGTLTGLTASGSINFSTSSSVSLGVDTNIKITGGSPGQYLQTDGTGNVSWNSTIFDNITNGTSNASIPTINGNIRNYVNGNLTFVVTSTGANVTGYANVSGNVSAANVTVVGNVNANILNSSTSTGAPLTVNSTTRVANLNVARANVSDYTLVTTTGSGNMNFTFTNANNTANYSLYSNTAVYANLSSGSIYAANFVGNGSQVTGVAAVTATTATTAGTVTTAAQPSITSLGTLTGLSVTGAASFTGLTVFAETQDITVSGTPSGVVTYDATTGVVFDVVPTANWTANITNIPTTNNRVTVITFIVTQGATAYLPTVFQIAGVTQTVKWIGSLAPTGTPNKIDLLAYSLVRSGTGSWIVLGSASSYG